MRVQMVRIGHMRVRMVQGFMPMPMAVLPHRHVFMPMQVVPIVMRMGMFVFKHRMIVRMVMRFK